MPAMPAPPGYSHISRNSQQAVVVQEKTKEPSLAFVDAVIDSNKDSSARRALQDRLQKWYRRGVSLLWINTLRHRADIRLVCLVQDFRKFNTLVLDEIRSVDGVRATRTTFSFNGVANVDLLLDLEMEVLPHTGTSSSYLQLSVVPGEDRNVLEAITSLPSSLDVRVVWALNTYSHASDLSLLLLGLDGTVIADYIMTHIRPIEGLVDTETDEIVEWAWMAEPEAIISLCEMFCPEEEEDEDLIDIQFEDLLDQDVLDQDDLLSW